MFHLEIALRGTHGFRVLYNFSDPLPHIVYIYAQARWIARNIVTIVSVHQHLIFAHLSLLE